ncbi:MAG TPA: flagellar motor switch protein FliN [Gemmataceae bacterium]|nr:flagellar motor switch protein FliN [Gemmataceae bacterium]
MSASSSTSNPETKASKVEKQSGGASAPPVEVRAADFAELKPQASSQAPNPLDSLLDVSVLVTVELGRTSLTINDVLKLGVGSVVELDRLVLEPVDLMVQGVRLARGEVVVVGDRFAILIKEIADPKERL